MKYLPLLLIISLSSIELHAKKEDEKKFPVAAIPATLKENAHAVIREANMELKILSLNKVRYNESYTVTILDAKGKGYAALRCGYNLLQKIDGIKGRLFDEEGKLVKEMDEDDATDISTFGSSFVFHSDSRLKKFDFDYNKYPYTVSFIIEKTNATTFFLPSWDVQPTIDCAVEKSTFKLTYSDKTPVKFKEYNMPETLSKTTLNKDGDNELSWSVTNVTAKYEQPLSKSGNYDGPTVVLSSDKFDLLKHEGSMGSWKDLGLFIYNLNAGLDVLPEDKKAMVKSLTENVPDTYGKIQKLYKYMQESTRYVAIEYGIAGWQTFDAFDVAKNGYGDCKGLTNYLKALLKEAGIPSYATLVFAGDEDYFKLEESFPSNVFNHVILCVPGNNDTTWVECTSQKLTAGYLGSFTQGRKVLLITENGGIISQTPSYNADKNYVVRHATLNLDLESSSQKINMSNRYSGPFQDELSYFIKSESDKKIKEMVNSRFPFASYTVENYNYNPSGSYLLPELAEKVDVAVLGITTKTQKRTFLNVGWMNNPMTSISQSKPRTAPLVLNESYKITDTVTINLPENTELESLPEAVNLSFDFGSYTTRFEKGDKKIIFIRTYSQRKGVFKVTDYENYLKMYNTVNAGKNNLNIVFLNKAS